MFEGYFFSRSCFGNEGSVAVDGGQGTGGPLTRLLTQYLLAGWVWTVHVES